MNENVSGFELDLKIPSRVILIILEVLGFAIFLASIIPSNLGDRFVVSYMPSAWKCWC
jgi:hypothetical protein